jgi:protein-disulfide isomerase
MRTKILGVVIIFLGVAFGLLFNMMVKTSLLTRQLVAQQAEMIDWMRLIVNGDKKYHLILTEVKEDVDVMAKVVKQAPQPQPAERPQPPQEDFDKVYEIPLEGAQIKGPKNAPVTIIGFLDLQCPFSKRFQPVIEETLAAYPGKVRYIVKDFPLGFHQEAIPAAKALRAAGEQGKYWEMLAAILENNNQLGADKYQELAKGIGLNVKKFSKDLAQNDEKWTKEIQEEFQLGTKVDVRGTPTYYLNGKKTMARTAEAFKAEIDKILAGNK